jgi:hypothetical protein
MRAIGRAMVEDENESGCNEFIYHPIDNPMRAVRALLVNPPICGWGLSALYLTWTSSYALAADLDLDQ